MTNDFWRNPWLWVFVICSLTVTVVTRFYALETIPFGADGDVMWMSVDAADFVIDGVIPHYVDPVYAPDPVIVYLIGLSQALFGISLSTARLVTATASVLTAVLMIPMMWELLHEEEKHFRLVAGLCAMLAVMSSFFSIHMARIGHNSPLLAPAIAMTIWWAAAAWYRGGWWRWIVAGICLASTQYIYLTGRMMALVAIGWFFYTLLVMRPKMGKRWQGWILMGLVAFVLVLPNIILFVLWPSSFTERVDPTATTGVTGFVWNSHWAAEGRLPEFFARKIWNIIQVTGIEWQRKQLPMSTPVLAPVFFAGWCLGLLVSLIRFRRMGYGLLIIALPILMLGDLITSPEITPTPMRHNQILPVHYALAGIGLAVAWQFLRQRAARIVQVLAGIVFCLVVFIPTITQFYQYVTVYVPELYTNPDNSGRVNQTDVEISRRITAEPEQSYLLSYSDYTRKTTAWLTLAEFPDRHSAVMADGSLNLSDLPDELVIVQSTVPDRARHDMGIGLEWERWWVLLHEGQTLYLPPLQAGQIDSLKALMSQAPTEDVIDSSGQVVATLYTVPLPDSFFTMPDYVSVDARIGKSQDKPEVELVGYTTYPENLVAGEPLYVSLYWRPIQKLNENYEIFVQLWDDDAQVYAESHELPYEATYRTRLWQPDEITVTHHVLFVNEELPPQRYSLAANFYRVVQNEALLASGRDVTPDNAAVLMDDFRVVPEQNRITVDDLSATIRFGDELEIKHLEIQQNGDALDVFGTWTLTPGEELHITMQWDVLERPRLDYSYFLHLIPVDEQQPITQYDSALRVEDLPAGAWRSGDIWFDTADLQLPATMPDGTYNLWLGVYHYADGTRLNTFLNNGLEPEPRVLLGQVRVE